MRLDVWLAARDIKSREEAKRLITEGHVLVNGRTAKPSYEVHDGDDIRVTAVSRYVSRGGQKLEAAINAFNIDMHGLVCLDIGASTGGFTDCMLQNGAEFVYALDVGHSQLDHSLAADKRVRSMEGVNIRSCTRDMFERHIDFVSCDVSFISLRLVLPVIYSLLDGGRAVTLIKPQFECGRSDLGKGGIVKSGKVRERTVNEIKECAAALGLRIVGVIPSPIEGGDGNHEYLMLTERPSQP